MRAIGFVFFLLAPLAVVKPADLPEITPCDIQPGRFVGQLIRITSKLVFTMHGAAMVSENCATRGQHAAALFYPSDPGAPHVGFEVDPRAIEQLVPYYRTTGGSAVACAVVEGEIFYQQKFKLNHPGGMATGNGFGAHGALGAAFVIKKVAQIKPCT